MFGVFPHTVNLTNVKLLRGFDEVFYVPQSRHTEVRREDIERCPDLEILSESEEVRRLYRRNARWQAYFRYRTFGI